MSCLRAALLLCLLTALAAGQGIFGPLSQEQLTKLLFNREYVQKQLGCVLGRGSCDQTGRQLRVAIPEVLVRQCRSCNPEQAENARKVISFIQASYPQEWAQIQAKYKRPNHL